MIAAVAASLPAGAMPVVPLSGAGQPSIPLIAIARVIHHHYHGGVGGVHPGYRPGYRPVPGRAYYRPGYRHGPVVIGPGFRPTNPWWTPGGAIAAGAAIGVISAAAAAAWAGQPPGPNYCWYYTDPSRQQGFWDVCR